MAKLPVSEDPTLCMMMCFKSQKLISRRLQSGPVDSVPFSSMDSGVGREW